MSKELRKRPGLILIGPLPPPPFGCSNLNGSLLRAAQKSQFNFISLETTDRRPRFNYGRLDAVNMLLAIKHILRLFLILISQPVSIVYLTVSTTPWAYFRDGLFILIARLFRKKIVVHSHGRENRLFYDRSGPLLRWFIRATLKLATGAACECERVKTVVFDGLIPLEKVWAVPNGVFDPFLEEDAGKGKGWEVKPAGQRIAYVAHMWEPKGYRELLAVAPDIFREFPEIRFSFAGRWADQNEQDEAMRMRRELKLESNVEYLGLISDDQRTRLLRESSFFVFPTKFWTEGQPLSIIDALAAGLPIISSDIGCIPEMVVDGENGFLTKPGDQAALKAAILTLLKDRALCERMGYQSRNRYLQYYNERAFVQGMERLFCHVYEN
jgi:glycosyltransferase involved in cell wall biosynthesis